MELYLSNNIYFVEGKKNAAIYNLNNNKVYVINELAKIAIIKYYKKCSLSNDEQYLIQKLISNNLVSIDREEITEKFKIPIPKYKIDFAWLELTDKCNLKCVHCYGNFGCIPKNKNNYLTKKEWFNVIDQLYNLGCNHIQLIGGEPLCSNDFIEILKYANNKGIKHIVVFTNATLINKNNINILKECNVSIRFSLYGYNAETHDNITQVKGSFKKTIEAIQLLKSNNIKVSVAVVIMKENENIVEKIKKFVINELKINYNGFDVIRPSNVNDNLEHRISSYDLLEKRYETYPKFTITKQQFFNNHYYNPCWNSKIAITAEGDIIPCIFARNFIIGNIRNNNLNELQSEILKKWKITKNKIDECNECEYRYACFDCRPLAIGVNNKKYSKYPRCCYSPKEGIWKNIKDVTKEIKKR